MERFVPIIRQKCPTVLVYDKLKSGVLCNHSMQSIHRCSSILPNSFIVLKLAVLCEAPRHLINICEISKSEQLRIIKTIT